MNKFEVRITDGDNVVIEGLTNLWMRPNTHTWGSNQYILYDPDNIDDFNNTWDAVRYEKFTRFMHDNLKNKSYHGYKVILKVQKPSRSVHGVLIETSVKTSSGWDNRVQCITVNISPSLYSTHMSDCPYSKRSLDDDILSHLRGGSSTTWLYPFGSSFKLDKWYEVADLPRIKLEAAMSFNQTIRGFMKLIQDYYKDNSIVSVFDYREGKYSQELLEYLYVKATRDVDGNIKLYLAGHECKMENKYERPSYVYPKGNLITDLARNISKMSKTTGSDTGGYHISDQCAITIPAFEDRLLEADELYSRADKECYVVADEEYPKLLTHSQILKLTDLITDQYKDAAAIDAMDVHIDIHQGELITNRGYLIFHHEYNHVNTEVELYFIYASNISNYDYESAHMWEKYIPVDNPVPTNMDRDSSEPSSKPRPERLLLSFFENSLTIGGTGYIVYCTEAITPVELAKEIKERCMDEHPHDVVKLYISGINRNAKVVVYPSYRGSQFTIEIYTVNSTNDLLIENFEDVDYTYIGNNKGANYTYRLRKKPQYNPVIKSIIKY